MGKGTYAILDQEIGHTFEAFWKAKQIRNEIDGD